MKKPYQIESQRAVRQLEEMAADGNPAVQMVLPMAEMVGWLHKGVGALIRQAGLRVMELLMEEEVRERVGERSQQQADRTANRWGKERGFCVVMGQKVPIDRPRVRTTDDREVRLGSYEMFHRGEPLTETVWEKLMLGLSTRKYGQAVREFAEAQGAVVCAAHRRDAVCRAADGGCAGHQPGRAENDLGHSARSHRERHRCGRVAGRPDEPWARSDRATAIRSGRRQGASRGGEKVCRRVGADPALSSSQAAQRAGSSDRRTEAFRGQEAERGLRA